MSASSVVAGLPGVRYFVVGDGEGNVLEQQSSAAEGKQIVMAISRLMCELDRVGALLELGTTELVTLRNPTTSWVCSSRSGSVMAVEVEPNRPATAVESALRGSEWWTLIERPLTDNEIEYLPDDVAEFVAAPAQENPPPAPPSAGAAAIVPKWSELRRALIRGQLWLAERLATQLRDKSVGERDASGAVVSFQALRPLLGGIASILAGDSSGGLESLKLVDTHTSDVSFRWVARVWSARASVNVPNGVDDASRHVDAALALASRLDTQARAVTTLLRAEVAFERGDLKSALPWARRARDLFAGVPDQHELARCWLLEARILLPTGKVKESVEAARRAHQCRPSWPPPVTFMAKRALHEGRLDDAERALVPLLESTPVPSEVERVRRILEHVRAGVVPAPTAYDYMCLLDAPPNRESIHQLEKIADAYPRIEQFRDALGWKLLRAGEYESASVVFERLSARADLPDDVHASVLLALGCLAAAEQPDAEVGHRLRAAVGAAPKHLQSASPPPPSSGKMPVAAPVDLRVPPAAKRESNAPEFPQSATVPKADTSGPVFTGSLQMFCLPDLLEFLRSGQRTGTLVCSSVAGIGAVHLRKGRITNAASPAAKDLREYFLTCGALTGDKLQAVSKIKRDAWGTPFITRALLNDGLVTPEQLRCALRLRIREAIRELVSWGEGKFAFDPELAPGCPGTEVDADVDAQALLLDIYKEMDEAARQSS